LARLGSPLLFDGIQIAVRTAGGFSFPMVPAPRALVVDDDEAIRQILTKILEREGLTVESAADGFEAIEKIREGDYALILLDLMMPHIDGFGVLRFLGQSRPDELSNVVVMTALSPEYLHHDLPRVIFKPFDMDLLMAYAREAVAGIPLHGIAS
jgi:CheY-like chemotaxis protein